MARRKSPAGAVSESAVLGDALSYVRAIRESISGHRGAIFLTPERQMEWLTRVEEKLESLKSQAVAGIHANPSLVVFGNPGHGRTSRDNLMSNDVLAVLYRHRDDGEFYVHGFGDASLKLKGSPRNGVGIGGLKERTGVKMVANKDGSVTLFHDRHPIHGEF